MPVPVYFDDDAKLELRREYASREAFYAGSGVKLAAEIDTMLAAIAAHPMGPPEFDDGVNVPDKRVRKQTLVKHSDYSIIYIYDQGEVTVIVVRNANLDPAEWMWRMRTYTR